MIVVCRAQKGESDKDHRQNTRKVLFIATVYSFLAAFHIPFMRLLQKRGYDVYAAASSAGGRKEEVGVTWWGIPIARSSYSPANIQAFRRLMELLNEQYFDLIHVHTSMVAFIECYLQL